jgi:hypothetical protein
MNDLERNRFLRLENQVEALRHQLILANQAIAQLMELEETLQVERQATLSRIRSLQTLSIKRP